MPIAVHSRLDFSALHARRARRIASVQDAATRLAVLRRLQRQYVTHDLPHRSAETRVEQSFNEQLFARVLGYRTLLSHDNTVYHVEPKLTRGRRTADFSLGFFGGEDARRVVVSAELKDPGADLDKPQSGGYGGASPVQQAFAAAKAAGGCAWVIVSNFRELRLYRYPDQSSAFATVDLLAVRGVDALAR
jgi:hypothetical protein